MGADIERCLVPIMGFVIKRGEKVEERHKREMRHIIESWPYDTRQQQVEKFRMLFPKKSNNTLTNVWDALTMLRESVKSAVVILSTRDTHLEKSISTELKQLSSNIYFSDTATTDILKAIPGPVELVIFPLSLHNMRSKDRLALFSSISTQLPNARVVMQEYDLLPGASSYMCLDACQGYLASKSNIKRHAFHPTSAQALQQEFLSAGLALTRMTQPKDLQRVYWSLYTPSVVPLDVEMLIIPGSKELFAIQATQDYRDTMLARSNARKEYRIFSHTDIILQPDAPRLKYWKAAVDTIESVVVKWGQLKLFAETLYTLLTYWNWQAEPNPVVVYAGAAEGRNIEIIASMLPAVTWELYDDRKFDISATSNIRIHSALFTDDTAKSYYNDRDRIMFMSDIRNSNREEDVLEDMRVQRRWVEIMQPKVAVLKMRVPFPRKNVSDEFEYLAGDVLLQPFLKKGSAETRLVVTDPNSIAVYSKLQYEEQMFYHNMVTRNIVLYTDPSANLDGIVDDDGNLDNHYDSIYLLYVLKQYAQFAGSPLTPLQLSKRVRNKLNAYSPGDPFVIGEERAIYRPSR